jgi:hypothetical protein
MRGMGSGGVQGRTNNPRGQLNKRLPIQAGIVLANKLSVIRGLFQGLIDD